MPKRQSKLGVLRKCLGDEPETNTPKKTRNTRRPNTPSAQARNMERRRSTIVSQHGTCDCQRRMFRKMRKGSHEGDAHKKALRNLASHECSCDSPSYHRASTHHRQGLEEATSISARVLHIMRGTHAVGRPTCRTQRGGQHMLSAVPSEESHVGPAVVETSRGAKRCLSAHLLAGRGGRGDVVEGAIQHASCGRHFRQHRQQQHAGQAMARV